MFDGLRRTSRLLTLLLALPAPTSAAVAQQTRRSDFESSEQWLSYSAESTKANDEAKVAAHLKTIAETRQYAHTILAEALERLLKTFDVRVVSQTIDGVRVDIITPAKGVPPRNRERVLVNLHGGAFSFGAGILAKIESIPIAALGGYKVVAIDYRLGPENHFPAASKDVATVYRALLRNYRPEDVGIFGCSAGGALTAQAIAWFEANHMPRPGAIGIFGSGAVVGAAGVSNPEDPDTPNAVRKRLSYFDVPNLDLRSSLVSPVFHPETLRHFPPTLLITGTRDQNLSAAAFTHASLVKVGVPAELHVIEGGEHCSFAGYASDDRIPETHHAWRVITEFFDHNLGHSR
jgi:epsilon-lactone hydrolase